jgi:hypothetical protein
MKIKTIWRLPLLISLLWWCLPMAQAQTIPETGFDDASRKALRDLATQVRESLKADTKVPRQATLCLLPITNDKQAYLGDLLKTAVTDAGLTYVEGRDDPLWPALLKEMEMNKRQDDILDPTTLTSFGKLKAAKLLMYATIREVKSANGQACAEATLHVSAVETKEHLWGDSFTGMWPLPDLAGSLPWGEKELQLINLCREDLGKAWTQVPELRGMKIAIFGLAGDRDQMVTLMVSEALQKAGAVPVRIEAASQSEARRLVAAKPGTCDAILSGAFRGPAKELVQEGVAARDYRLFAILQVRIEKAAGAQLWSQSFTKSLTWQEPKSKDSVGLQTKKAAEGHPWMIFGILGALAVMFLIWRIGVPR